MSPTPERLSEIAMAMRGFADELATPTTTSAPAPASTPTLKLLLNEQFDSIALNPRWRRGKPGTASGGHRGYDTTEKGYYLPNRSFQKNNSLILEAIAKPVNVVNDKSQQGKFVAGTTEDMWYTNGDSGVFPWQTGTVTTGPDLNGMINGLLKGDWTPQPSAFDFLYGTVEARMKLPKGNGLWPAFWLLQSNGIWPPEIDILEGVDPTNSSIAQHYHYGLNKTDFTKYAGKGYPIPFDSSTDFHVYGVDWQPDYIRWYIDGVLTQEFTDKANIPNKPMYILLNLAVGGSWPEQYGKVDNSKFPAQMIVDYLKVWQ